MIKKVKTIMKVFFVFALMLTLYSAFSINVNAAENSKDYLPEGWTRIETGSLTEEQISQLAESIGNPNNIVQPREPAPALTHLEIIDLAVDENNEIHVVTYEIGTSKPGLRFVYWNGNMCDENHDATELITGSDNIVDAYIRYFHTGVYYSTSLSGTSVRVTAQSTNAMNPWNTLSDSHTFILP